MNLPEMAENINLFLQKDPLQQSFYFVPFYAFCHTPSDLFAGKLDDFEVSRLPPGGGEVGVFFF